MQAFIGIRTLFKRIKAIWYMLKDKNVALWKKVLVVVGMAYLIMPIEVIPDILLPVGFVDDLVLWICILYLLRDTLDTYWQGEKTNDYSKKYKNTITGVDFEVKEEEKETVKEEAKDSTKDNIKKEK